MNQLLKAIYEILPIEDINNAEDLIIYQEYGIALDLICVQLYEYDRTIDAYIKNLILELILDMGLDMNLIDGIKVSSDGAFVHASAI